MAKTSGRLSALFQAVFEISLNKAFWGSSASSTGGAVSIGISPWVGFLAVSITGVAEVSVPLAIIIADIAVFVDGVVCAGLENILRSQFIPGIAALSAAVFLAVRDVLSHVANDDIALGINNGVVLVPFDVADDRFRVGARAS